MEMTNIKLDRHFFIIAITQKLFAGFYLNLYPVVVMKFFISHNFFFLIPTVSYWACPTWYVSSSTPLSPTGILTDTPEKNEIEEDFKRKQDKDKKGNNKKNPDVVYFLQFPRMAKEKQSDKRRPTKKKLMIT